MKKQRALFSEGVGSVAGAELRELPAPAGLYILHPAHPDPGSGSSLLAVGGVRHARLLTPGTSAVAIAAQATTLVLLLLLFYTVESLERERSTGLSQILYATPLRTGAFLLGKAVANSVVGGVVLSRPCSRAPSHSRCSTTVPFSLAP